MIKKIKVAFAVSLPIAAAGVTYSLLWLTDMVYTFASTRAIELPFELP